jgi:hypothetical protein
LWDQSGLTRPRSPVFETAPFDRSGTSPQQLNSTRAKNKTRRNPDGATHRRSLLPIYFAAEFGEAAFDFPGRTLANSVNVFILSRSRRPI